MKKVITILLIILAIPLLLIVAAVFVLAYFGFVPGLSDLMGASRPRDLGIKYSQEDFNNYRTKSKYRQTEITAAAESGNTLNYSGQIEVSNTFSAEEVSARINYSRWKYMPLTNFQIRFSENDTVEFSGNLRLDRFPGFIAEVENGKYTKEDVEKFMKYLDFAITNPPIYAKAKVSVTDNQADISLESFKLGKFDLNVDKGDFSQKLEGAVEQIFSQVPGLYAKSVSFTPDGMHFEGTTPETGTVVTF